MCSLELSTYQHLQFSTCPCDIFSHRYFSSTQLLFGDSLDQSRATFSERGPDETFQSGSRAGVTNENPK